MSNVLIEKNTVDLLANAISDKSGVPVTMTLGEMVEAVDSIEAGITPSGNINITQAGTTDVTSYATATVQEANIAGDYDAGYSTASNIRKWGISPYVDSTGGWVDSGEIYSFNIKYNAIAKNTSVTPTESSQTIGGANYMMEGAVTVNAIPSDYVGSGIPGRDASDLTVSGDAVSVPYGYYEDGASARVASGSATPASTISATGASVSTGTNTLTLSKTVSNTPTVSAGYVSSGTAGNSSVSLTASVTTQAAQTIYPSTSDQTINSGRYLTGNQTIKAVTTSNLSAENIKSGVTITVGDSADADRVASVTGTYTGGGGSANIATATMTNSDNQNTSISFTLPSGRTPKAFFARLTSQIARNSSSRYYYVFDMRWDGSSTGGVAGNTFYMYSGTLTNVTSGYSYSQSNTTFTLSSTGSRSASPGSFYNGTYELIYVY